MTLRQHLLEAGIEDGLGGLIGQQHGDEHTDDHDYHAVVEDQTLKPVAGFLVKVGEILDKPAFLPCFPIPTAMSVLPCVVTAQVDEVRGLKKFFRLFPFYLFDRLKLCAARAD